MFEDYMDFMKVQQDKWEEEKRIEEYDMEVEYEDNSSND